MKLKDLKEFIANHPELDDNTPVIIEGEYSYGMNVGKPYLSNMSYLEEQEVVYKNKDVVSIPCDTYLYESEDLGYCDMWVDNTTAAEMEKEWAEDGDEEE